MAIQLSGLPNAPNQRARAAFRLESVLLLALSRRSILLSVCVCVCFVIAMRPIPCSNTIKPISGAYLLWHDFGVVVVVVVGGDLQT